MPQLNGHNHLITPIPRSLLRLLGLGLLALLLAACGTAPGGPAQQADTAESGAGYLLTIDLQPGVTQQQIESAYDGSAIVWKDGEFAVLALETDSACEECGFSVLGASPAVESNEASFAGGGKIVSMNRASTIWSGGRSTIWSGGRSTIWSGGRSTIWSGARSTIWSGGEFQWMPENTELWQQVNLEQGQQLAANLGFGIKVAVIDTGVDLEHPALREALAPASEWRDFVAGDDLPQEEGELFTDAGYGHGTSVAGIIRQVAPRATILPLRVLGPDGSGDAADLTEAIVWAVDQGADVINLSLGGPNHLRAVDSALRYAARNGVFVISSTGDTRNGEKKVSYPASESHMGTKAPLLLSVTSVDRNDARSDFATYHQTKVELAAPGEDVFGPAPMERQVAWSGTSMSAPMAAGALALALGETLQVTRESLADELKSNSLDIYQAGLNLEYQGELGQGRLDLAAFLEHVVSTADYAGN